MIGTVAPVSLFCLYIMKVLYWCSIFFMLSAPVYGQSVTPSDRPGHWAESVSIKDNLFRVTDNLYRGEQPLSDDLPWIRELNIRTVVNLRTSRRSEKELAGSNLRLVQVPMHAWSISDQQVAMALAQIRIGQKQGNVLLHCYHGSDRTGLVVAMYRIIYQNWSIDEAKKEMKEGGYGFHSVWVNINSFFEPNRIDRIRQLAKQELASSDTH